MLSEPCDKVTHDTALPLELPVQDPPAMLLHTFYLLDGVDSVLIHELLGELRVRGAEGGAKESGSAGVGVHP